MIGNIIAIILNIIILYYIYQLEDITCNCIRDWRHDFIKYSSIFLIICEIIDIYHNITQKYYRLIVDFIIVLYCIFIFNYIGELDSTKCTCAVKKQKNIHNFLFYFWRYILLICVVFIIVIKIYLFYKKKL